MKKLGGAALALCFLSGCVFMKVSLTEEIQPLEERVLSGEGADKILLINLSGIISSRSNTPRILGDKKRTGMIVRLREELDRSRNDVHIKALLLRINSPGGTVTASDTLYHEIKQFKRETGIPVVVHFLDVGASGAYYAALAADRIFAQPTTVTGSIGVVMFRIDASGLMQNVGIHAEEIASGKRKGMGSPFRRLSPQERDIFRDMIDGMHERFVNTVSEERGLPLKQVRRLADGRIYTSEQARSAGLIDGIGYLDDSLKEARKLANLEEATVVAYFRPGEYRPNIYSLNLLTIDMGAILEPGVQFMYLWWL